MPVLKPDGRRVNGRGSNWITKLRRLAIYLRDDFTCLYCGKNLHHVDPREITLDHLRPQARGGSHVSSNLVTACLGCNSRRQHAPWWKFASAAAFRDIQRARRRVLPLALAKALLGESSSFMTKEWCVSAAEREGDREVGVGSAYFADWLLL